MKNTTPRAMSARTHFEVISSRRNGDWVNIIIKARSVKGRWRTRKYYLGFNMAENRFRPNTDFHDMGRNPNIDAEAMLNDIRARLSGLKPQQEGNHDE